MDAPDAAAPVQHAVPVIGSPIAMSYISRASLFLSAVSRLYYSHEVHIAQDQDGYSTRSKATGSEVRLLRLVRTRLQLMSGNNLGPDQRPENRCENY